MYTAVYESLRTLFRMRRISLNGILDASIREVNTKSKKYVKKQLTFAQGFGIITLAPQNGAPNLEIS